MTKLQAQLDAVEASQTSERSKMEEKLLAEHAQREQAEKALSQHQEEMRKLKQQLNQVKNRESPEGPTRHCPRITI